MAKDETRRWRGWRTSQPGSAVQGSPATKKPGTRRKKKDKLRPWYWIKSKKAGKCGLCNVDLDAGQIVAWSAPDKLRCGRCVRRTGLKVTTSRKLAEERAQRNG